MIDGSTARRLDAMETDATGPDVIDPPDATTPDTVDPDATTPDTVDPDATTPDTTIPDASADATIPDASVDTTGPDVIDPPDATIPDASVDTIEDTGPCVPKCDGETCGDDGCGVTCGDCEEGDFCFEGVCTTPSGFTCMDTVAFECPSAANTACACLGCNNDGVCGDDDDCVCADCADASFCAGTATGEACANDGICNPYAESCGCADCFGHSACVVD